MMKYVFMIIHVHPPTECLPHAFADVLPKDEDMLNVAAWEDKAGSQMALGG